MFDDVFKSRASEKLKAYVDSIPEEDIKYLDKCVKYFEVVDGWIEMVQRNMSKQGGDFEDLYNKWREALSRTWTAVPKSPEYARAVNEADNIEFALSRLFHQIIDYKFTPFSSDYPYSKFQKASTWLNKMGTNQTYYHLEMPTKLFPKPFDVFSSNNARHNSTKKQMQINFKGTVVADYTPYKSEWFTAYNKLKEIRNVR